MQGYFSLLRKLRIKKLIIPATIETETLEPINFPEFLNLFEEVQMQYYEEAEDYWFIEMLQKVNFVLELIIKQEEFRFSFKIKDTSNYNSYEKAFEEFLEENYLGLEMNISQDGEFTLI